jgi:hypothetical protein
MQPVQRKLMGHSYAVALCARKIIARHVYSLNKELPALRALVSSLDRGM